MLGHESCVDVAGQQDGAPSRVEHLLQQLAPLHRKAIPVVHVEVELAAHRFRRLQLRAGQVQLDRGEGYRACHQLPGCIGFAHGSRQPLRLGRTQRTGQSLRRARGCQQVVRRCHHEIARAHAVEQPGLAQGQPRQAAVCILGRLGNCKLPVRRHALVPGLQPALHRHVGHRRRHHVLGPGARTVRVLAGLDVGSGDGFAQWPAQCRVLLSAKVQVGQQLRRQLRVADPQRPLERLQRAPVQRQCAWKGVLGNQVVGTKTAVVGKPQFHVAPQPQ